MNRIGGSTFILSKNVSAVSFAAAVGKTEGEGTMGSCFDFVAKDDLLGEKTWEASESSFQKTALELALRKAGMESNDVTAVFAGDLLNQCAASFYGLRNFGIASIGVYGACSTMAETLILASVLCETAENTVAAAVTSSHYETAERQYRFPITYGGVRPPTSQWTATAAGAAVISRGEKPPFIKGFTIGRIVDTGLCDANDMGSAMAAAAYDTLKRHFEATGTSPDDYDAVFTGDLGSVGSGVLRELAQQDGVDLHKVHRDCGVMIYDPDKQDVHAGGSGAGCSASILCGHILPEISNGRLKRVLFAATGALMSPTMVQQGESIPGIAHLVEFSDQALADNERTV